MHLKLFQRERFKINAKATGDLIGNKYTVKITRVSKAPPQNNSEVNEEEILRERYISPGDRQKILNDLKLYLKIFSLVCSVFIIQ